MNKNHFYFALLFHLTFPIISIITAQSSPPCIQSCPGGGASLNHLPFPFGFSDGCQIRLNCTKNGQVLIGEFQVQNLTSDNLIIKIQPKCNRSIQSLVPLFNRNFAIAWQNGLLLQDCSSKPSGCVIPEALLRTQFDLKYCERPSCFSSMNEKENSSFMTLGYVNQSSCKFIYSSIAVLNSSSSIELEFQMLRLGWWLEGTCNCSSNAVCTEVISPVNFRRGYRCRCSEGYQGDGFLAGRGCSKATSKCNPRKYLSSQCGGTTRLAVLIAGFVGGASLMAASAFLCYRIRQRSTSSKIRKNTKKLFTDAGGSGSLPFYRYKEIKHATYGFSEKYMLGTGAYGTVYAGKLHNDEWVAIKRIRYRDGDSIEQVVNEIKLLSSVTHPNLVRLLGFCIERGEQILVYEFMSNGTLSEHLQKERGTGLPWATRLAIASETAQAIAHLHFALDPPIYHRDVKSTNILLDSNLNSKVADFGLSRFGMTELSHISTAPQGTPGYLDPQYHQNFHLSDRSDVYSFGVVLLEIITGLKVVDFSRPPNEINLAGYAMEKIRKGCLNEIIDPFIDQHKDDWTLSSLHKVGELAFRCLAFHSETRPSMLEVSAELEQIRLSVCSPLNEKSLNIIVNNVDVKKLDLTVPKLRSFVVSDDEINETPRVSLQEIWLSEESSPSANSLLYNVFH